jgi:ubiquinone/menaquinone biosynthesis C-methylase UbiE
MKVRDSGMPEQEYWKTLFDIPLILDRMRVDDAPEMIAEFGCGYGTFTIPAAQRMRGRVIALDLESTMIEIARDRAAASGVANIDFILRDFVDEGTGISDSTVDYAMVFNILHHEKPMEILREARRILRLGRIAGIIHWNYDPGTPRGPKMEMRPKPEELRAHAMAAEFRVAYQTPIDLPPWHYGWMAEKPA